MTLSPTLWEYLSLTAPAEGLPPSTSDFDDLFKYLQVIMLEPATTIGHL